MKSGAYIYLLVLLSFLCINGLWAQNDAHYWTHQYGAKGLLLNGAVIASAEDETNIFYNPGAIGTDDNLGFAFSFLSPSFLRLSANNFLGDDNQIVDNGLDLAPGFLAFRFKPFKNKKLTLGIATFQRFQTDISLNDRVTDVINDTGQFLIRADLDFDRNVSEDWFGVGISYNISDYVGIGLSQFSTWHSQGLDFYLKKEVYLNSSPDIPVASWRNHFEYGISAYSGFISKVGLSFKSEQLSFGFTITSPTYGVLRQSANYAYDDQQIIANEELLTVLSNRNSIDLQNYRTPFSVGLGFEYHAEKYCFSFSTEYFAPLDQFTYFQHTDDSFDGLSNPPLPTEVSVRTARESVTNVAMGIQLYTENKRVTWLGGFRTDFNERSTLLLNDTAEYLSATPDVFHVSGGALIDYGKSVFSIGLDFGYGKSGGGTQIADLSDINTENFFTYSGKQNVSTNFFSATLFITYDFIYNRISKSKEEDK